MSYQGGDNTYVPSIDGLSGSPVGCQYIVVVNIILKPQRVMFCVGGHRL